LILVLDAGTRFSNSDLELGSFSNLLPKFFEVSELGVAPVLVDEDASVQLAHGEQADAGACNDRQGKM
jgi:hypothetical protein